MRWSMLVLAAVLMWVPHVRGYSSYADLIPNGGLVSVLCPDGGQRVTWLGVGHYNLTGSGQLNPFGQDFLNAGRGWSPGVCRADSDDDGRSNGEELGDPGCIWTLGAQPTFTTNISHPGICEPVESERCRSGANGSSVAYDVISSLCAHTAVSDDPHPPCDTLIPTADVHKATFRLKPLTVSKKSDSVRCESFLFNPAGSSDEYHVIALTPIANISGVVARMIMYVCKGEKLGGVGECNNIPDPSFCEVMAVWMPPLRDECLHHNAGIRLVTGGLKSTSFMLQVHLRKFTEESDVTGDFGVTVYFSSSFRQQDAGMLVVGNDYITIPPQSPAAIVTSDCTSTCTRSLFSGDVYIVSVISFLQELGTGQEITIYRQGSEPTDLINITFADSDAARMMTFRSPILVQPGDVIKTRCQYSSLDIHTTTFSSEGNPGAQWESCRAYLRFYPAQHAAPSPTCVSWKSLLNCDPGTEGGCTTAERLKFEHQNVVRTQAYTTITSSCLPFGPCTSECRAAIREVRAREPCMANPDSWLRVKTVSLITSTFGQSLLADLAGCDLDLYIDSQAAAAEERDREAASRSQLLRRKVVCSNGAQPSVVSLPMSVGLLAIFILLTRAGTWVSCSSL